jgi:hypothetical protein
MAARFEPCEPVQSLFAQWFPGSDLAQWYCAVVELTEEDYRIAKLASELLAKEWSCPELSVSADQLVRWRQVAHAIPVVRGGGRGNVTRYLPSAPMVAAALAVALDDGPRDLDLAVLAAYGNAVSYGIGAEPALDGVRGAFRHYSRKVEKPAWEAWKHRGKARSDVPRSRRIAFPGSRLADSYLVSDSVLATLLGVEDDTLPAEVRIEVAATTLIPEASTALEEPKRLGRIAGMLALGALRRHAEKVDSRDLSSSCRDMAALVDYCEALTSLINITGGDSKRLPEPLSQIVPMMNRAVRIMKIPRGAGITILGLCASSLKIVLSRSEAGRIAEAAQAAKGRLEELRATVAITEALPGPLRPALGLDGVLFQAQLSETDRSLIHQAINTWMNTHPTEARRIRSTEGSAAAKETSPTELGEGRPAT